MHFSSLTINRQTYYLLFLFICLNILTNCKTTGNQIRVKGRASNQGKLGACIFTRDSMLYQINDMYKWPREYEGKKLLVKGRLRVIPDMPIPCDECQWIFGKQYIIDSAAYRVTIFGHRRKEEKDQEPN
jgi:hypothetical protein